MIIARWQYRHYLAYVCNFSTKMKRFISNRFKQIFRNLVQVSHCSRFARGGARSRSPDKGRYYLRSCYRPHHPVEKRTNLGPWLENRSSLPYGRLRLPPFFSLAERRWFIQWTTSQVRGPWTRGTGETLSRLVNPWTMRDFDGIPST